MALSIKTVEADRLARELAALAHETITEAVTKALRERLERVRARQRVDIQHRLDRLVVEYSGHQVHDDRSPEEILGYDEVGLPR
jgi:antitoxin VapB